MNLQQNIKSLVLETIQNLFETNLESIEIQQTKPEFEGDVTVVLFTLVKLLKENPASIGNKIGENLIQNSQIITSFNIISGFLNLVISDKFYIDSFNEINKIDDFGTIKPLENEAIMVEFASPNTNKPLHLGHIRNILLGYSVAKISEAAGKKVYKTQIVNDRGIHICKSMLAWQMFGNGETPKTSGLKGDKLVGKYYVKFEKEFQKEYSEWQKTEDYSIEFLKDKNKSLAEKFNNDGEIPVFINDSDLNNDDFFANDDEHKIFKSNFKDKYFKIYSKIGNEAQKMLRKWEAGHTEIVKLWQTMNQWVYDGFEVTYNNLGVDFDSVYYESNTYLLGKEVVQLGLDKGVFKKETDGSVWIDLTPDGLDRKIVLRSDGTAVYMTQDIGTAIQRVKDFPEVKGMVYTVGNEQDYHFKVLFLILKKLGFDWANHLYHLSYGMVELPSGRMKSREGTVVDADDLMDEMTKTAQKICEELGKLEELSTEDKQKLYKIIGDAALKYFMLKVDPKKQMLFNPEESVDFSGNTGPFIQYTYARIQSILRKSEFKTTQNSTIDNLHEKEKVLVKQLLLFPEIIQQAAQLYSPAIIANYTYSLVKDYNSFYQSVPIIPETDAHKKEFRIQLSYKVGSVIKKSFELLGIEVPNRM
jgi:arginyl-tRNA synthetase